MVARLVTGRPVVAHAGPTDRLKADRVAHPNDPEVVRNQYADETRLATPKLSVATDSRRPHTATRGSRRRLSGSPRTHP